MKISELIAKKYDISNRLAKHYIRQGKVKIDNRLVKKDFKTATNEFPLEKIEIDISVKNYGTGYDIKDFLIKETPGVIFFYKPPFMHTERIKPEDLLTLEDIVKTSFPEYNLISRLDFGTDGVVPALKTDIEISFMKKTYIMLVDKIVKDTVVTDSVIDASRKKKVKVINPGYGLKREFIPIRYFKNRTLLKVVIESATRHELRALISECGLPILGDDLYGGEAFPRMMLRCQKVTINGESASSNHLRDFIKMANYTKI